jgi:hypothetical protein
MSSCKNFIKTKLDDFNKSMAPLSIQIVLVTLLCFNYHYSNAENSFNIQLNSVKIPKTYKHDTVYICQEFVLPFNESFDYSLIKFNALIEEIPIVHHMLLFACPIDANIPPSVRFQFST